jgi:hypothetical protein
MVEWKDATEIILALTTLAMFFAALMSMRQTNKVIEQMTEDRKEKYLITKRNDIRCLLGKVVSNLLWMHMEAPRRVPTSSFQSRIETIEEWMVSLEDQELEETVRAYIAKCESNKQLLPLDKELYEMIQKKKRELEKELKKLDEELERLAG